MVSVEPAHSAFTTCPVFQLVEAAQISQPMGPYIDIPSYFSGTIWINNIERCAIPPTLLHTHTSNYFPEKLTMLNQLQLF